MLEKINMLAEMIQDEVKNILRDNEIKQYSILYLLEKFCNGKIIISREELCNMRTKYYGFEVDAQKSMDTFEISLIKKSKDAEENIH